MQVAANRGQSVVIESLEKTSLKQLSFIFHLKIWNYSERLSGKSSQKWSFFNPVIDTSSESSLSRVSGSEMSWLFGQSESTAFNEPATPTSVFRSYSGWFGTGGLQTKKFDDQEKN
ncbi:hypothetical protein CISG_04290 [Coccidioides immitis RMSCC 3703]|uniref:Uncharacterized protein n=1 Tax=Coccidioides immitis RMSCC 3703 TaxID=454286 RepID=A0A0J8QTL5_COCIT|nr:hypothetical protein CISG_04290 [Coccidioides immitis RMSCC 3703]